MKYQNTLQTASERKYVSPVAEPVQIEAWSLLAQSQLEDYGDNPIYSPGL